MTVSQVMLRGIDAAYPLSVAERAAGLPWKRAMDPAYRDQLLARALDSAHDPTQAARNGAKLLGGVPVLGEAGPAAAITGVHRPDVMLLYGAPRPGNAPSAPMFAHEIEQLGARPRLVAADRVTQGPGGRLYYEGLPMKQPDAVIARGVTPWGLELLDRLDAEGTHVVNRGWAIRESRGKNDMPRLFDKGGIPYPATDDILTRAQLEEAADKFGFPFVLKETHGSGGKQVRAINDRADLERAAREYVDTPGAPAIIASEMIDTAGVDLRWLGSRNLQGDPVPVGGLARYALAPGEFRANTSLGGGKAAMDVSGSGKPLVLPDVDPTGLDPAVARHMQERVEAVNARGVHVTHDDNRMFEEMMEVTGLDLMGGDGLPLPPGQVATLRRPGDIPRSVNFKIAEVNQTPGSPEINTAYGTNQSITAAAAQYAINGLRKS